MCSDDISRRKQALREDIAQYFRHPDTDFVRNRSRYDSLIAEGLFALPLWKGLKAVCVYQSFSDEVETSAIIQALRQEERPLYIPAEGDPGLQVYGSKSADHDLITEEGILVLTPGRCFDRSGNRLGRGGGYYDRLFAQLIRQHIPYIALGLCYSFQLLDSLPISSYDVGIHGVLNETMCIMYETIVGKE